MSGSLIPNAKQQFLDANGNPLAGGFVYFYIPSTTTFKNTYQDAALTILNTNPIILDSAGEAIIYGSGSYRQIVTDVNGNLIWDQTTVAPITLTDVGSVYSASNGSSLIGYNKGASGAVNRTVQSKLQESVSVLDFGAKGDGTTDDTAALQAAFDANLPLYFPCGTYKITSGLTFNPYLTYIGQNYSVGQGSSPVTIKAATTGITMLKSKTEYGYQTQFTNIFLDGDNKAAIGFQWLCTVQGDQADLTMTNVSAFNCTSKGFDLAFISYSLFNNVHTRNCPIGFYMYEGASCELNACEFGGLTTACLYLDKCGFIKVNNCYAFNSAAIGHLVLIDGGHGNKFEKCQFEPAPSPVTPINNAVSIKNTYVATDNCTDNTFLNCEWIGIQGSCLCNLNIGEGLTNPNQIYKTKVVNCSFIVPISTSSIELAAQRFTQIFSSVDTRIYNDGDYFNVSVSNDSSNPYYQEGYPGYFTGSSVSLATGIKEGNGQPAGVSGYSLIYLDVADNKLKIVSSGGTIRTITTTP